MYQVLLFKFGRHLYKGSIVFSTRAMIRDTNEINSNEIKYCFLWRGENRSPGEKPFGAEKRSNKLNADSGHRTWVTLVGGECIHHCDTTAPSFVDAVRLHHNELHEQ